MGVTIDEVDCARVAAHAFDVTHMWDVLTSVRGDRRLAVVGDEWLSVIIVS